MDSSKRYANDGMHWLLGIQIMVRKNGSGGGRPLYNIRKGLIRVVERFLNKKKNLGIGDRG